MFKYELGKGEVFIGVNENGIGFRYEKHGLELGTSCKAPPNTRMETFIKIPDEKMALLLIAAIMESMKLRKK